MNILKCLPTFVIQDWILIGTNYRPSLNNYIEDRLCSVAEYYI